MPDPEKVQHGASYGLVFPPIGVTNTVSPQGGDLRSERKIGAGTGFGVLWYARDRENASCPGKLTDLGGV